MLWDRNFIRSNRDLRTLETIVCDLETMLRAGMLKFLTISAHRVVYGGSAIRPGLGRSRLISNSETYWTPLRLPIGCFGKFHRVMKDPFPGNGELALQLWLNNQIE
jgi:hypothetical protein